MSSIKTSKTNASMDYTASKTRIQGKILNFISPRGIGFIAPDGKPDEEVYFHVGNLVGYEGDEFPIIPKSTPVEFVKVCNIKGWRAEDVSQPGGAKIISAEEDPTREYNKAVIYTGTVRMFDFRRGIGFITCDDEKIEWGGKTTETVTMVETKDGQCVERNVGDLYFPADEIICPKHWVVLQKGDKVQFNVYHDVKGLGAGKVLRTSKSKRKSSNQEGGLFRRWKRKKSSFSMIENDSYLQGNFRGAIQEHFDQINREIVVTFETVEQTNDAARFLSTARTIGFQDDKIVGLGYAPNKRSSIHFAALDLIFKHGIITKEEHIRIHNTEINDEQVKIPVKDEARKTEAKAKTIEEELKVGEVDKEKDEGAGKKMPVKEEAAKKN